MTNDENLTLTYTVPQTPRDVFEAIRDVRSWWSLGIRGPTAEVGDAFDYRHEELHTSRQQVVASVPGRTMVWRVLEAHLSFAAKPNEWKGTQIRFDLEELAEGTRIRFTHEGLGPSCDCYEACAKGWAFYVGQSLRARITEGRGLPDTEANGRPTAE
jgi:Activator of Hsp90 ATPase homolog 1-like protein